MRPLFSPYAVVRGDIIFQLDLQNSNLLECVSIVEYLDLNDWVSCNNPSGRVDVSSIITNHPLRFFVGTLSSLALVWASWRRVSLGGTFLVLTLPHNLAKITLS